MARKLPASFKKKLTITNESLAEIVGSERASRQDIVSAIWSYIKKKGNLQDGQYILASEDELLEDIFSGVTDKHGDAVMDGDGDVHMTGVASAIKEHTTE